MNRRRRRALLVGIDSYKYEAWTPIPYVRSDIEGPHGLSSVLQNDLGSRCLEPENIYTLIGSDATSDAIEQILHRICIQEAVEEEDEVLFYFSGHGIVHRTVDLPLLVTYETDPKSPHKSGITFEWLKGLATNSRARIMMVIDACFSGAIISDRFSDSAELAESAAHSLAELPHAAIFASCQPEETSGPSPEHTQSLFTSLFIDGLRGNANALDAGNVTTSSLKKFLEDSMVQEAQRPKIQVPKESWTLSVPHRPIGITPPTPDDRAFPWTRYLKSSILQYEESRLHSRHAFAQLITDVTSFVPNGRGDGGFNPETPLKKTPALNILEDLTSAGFPHVIVVLGDIGSGKTTILKRTCYNLALKAQHDDDAPIPVEVPLAIFRDIRFDEVYGDDDASVKAFEIASSKFRALLTDLIQHEYGVPLMWPEIESQVQTGKVTFIFDGLDEMGFDSRLGTISNCLHILCRFAELGAVVIISCRTHFLRNDEELERALQTTIRGEIPYSLVKLHRFSFSQVDNYIDSMSESPEIASWCRNFLKQSFRGTRQLAKRPFLLEILVSATQDFDVSRDAVPEYEVFQRFLDGWLARDRWRFSRFLFDYQDAVKRDIGKIANLSTKREDTDSTQNWAEKTIVYFIELLASDLRIEGKEEISYQEIPSRIRNRFPTMPEVFLHFFEYTLRTCSFLVRDASGMYKFLHPSIHSYFTARAILREIRREKYPWDAEGRLDTIPHSLGLYPLDELVQDLLADMLVVDDRSVLEKLARYKQSIQNPNTMRYLAGNCLLLLSDLHNNCLSGYDLHEAYICGVDLQGVDLRGADLRKSVMDSVNLEDANLSGAYIEGAMMNLVRFGGAKLTGVIVEDGTTVIKNPSDIELAKGVPEAIKRIVISSSKGERNYQRIEADGCEMKLIEGGRFWMGADANDSEAEVVEKPAHEVTLKSFWLDVHPVTNRQFARFVEVNPDWGKVPGIARTGNVYYLSLWEGNMPPPDLLDHPVVYVNWYAAVEYAKWAGKRLPTEAEWEFALRDRNHQHHWAFPWGPSEKDITEKLQKKLVQRGVRSTYLVCSISPNSYGLFDMTGNVNEWVHDWFDKDYWTSIADTVIHTPTGPPFGRMKVLRGGSFLSYRSCDFRCYFRRFLLPDNTNQDGGFRCARDDDHKGSY